MQTSIFTIVLDAVQNGVRIWIRCVIVKNVKVCSRDVFYGY